MVSAALQCPILLLAAIGCFYIPLPLKAGYIIYKDKMKRKTLATIFCLLGTCTAFPQAAITFGTQELDFGIIPYNRPAEATLTFTNTGDKPLKIDRVSTSCGCTVAHWPTSRIAPGKSGEITVTYDAKLMGHFFREMSIYCNAEPYMHEIALVGEVSNSKVDYTKSHPFKMGDLLLDTDELLFDDVEMGQSYEKRISIVNMGDEPYEPVLMLMPSYLTMTCEPAVLKHRQQGEMKVVLDGSKLKDVGLTQTSVYLSRYLGDKICDETNIEVSAFVLPDKSEVPGDELLNAPQIFVSATQWTPDFSKRKSRYTKTIEIGNSGKSPLSIERLQVSNRVLSVALKKKVIAPGEFTKMKVSLNLKHVKKHRSARIYIVTNDPAHPKEVITVNL